MRIFIKTQWASKRMEALYLRKTGTPYNNQVEFEMVEFLFTHNQMPAKQMAISSGLRASSCPPQTFCLALRTTSNPTSSAPTGNPTPAPTASSGMIMTHDQIVAENAHRLTDNVALQSCRDAGDINVPADELLIPLPPQPSGTALQQWISAFTKLSPTSQMQGSAILDSIIPKVISRPSVTSVVKVLFGTAKELPSGSSIDSTYSFGIHSFVQDLLNAGQYCPAHFVH
ncbi:uncharacterized protein EDB91DRAFT_1087265 [Suillus paluster]|uniref:uncharacterized protein n=1 Tax=Suillus paluster TaxID=48578 RepID=UPI001B8647EF|nr:uncharacterized protein EDB91DRAFT_1087265 [Suillus paluster]KAG1725000.1 hypothetical protein EDB91DRAFT_1087265 [Suillus paluster]